jgi:hypothetical protein
MTIDRYLTGSILRTGIELKSKAKETMYSGEQITGQNSHMARISTVA